MAAKATRDKEKRDDLRVELSRDCIHGEKDSNKRISFSSENARGIIVDSYSGAEEMKLEEEELKVAR